MQKHTTIIPFNKTTTYALVDVTDVSGEKYDVINLSTAAHCAHINFREGILECKYPDASGAVIFIYPFDDRYKNTFADIVERLNCIGHCLSAINQAEEVNK